VKSGFEKFLGLSDEMECSESERYVEKSPELKFGIPQLKQYHETLLRAL
jgi:hypothetical protein